MQINFRSIVPILLFLSVVLLLYCPVTAKLSLAGRGRKTYCYKQINAGQITLERQAAQLISQGALK